MKRRFARSPTLFSDLSLHRLRYAHRRPRLFYGRPLFFALEETPRPSTGRHGGIFTDAQNNQLGLWVIRVGGCFRFVHGLRGDDAAGRRVR